jgi:hypothetical protein
MTRDICTFRTTERAELHAATSYAFGEGNERLKIAVIFRPPDGGKRL